MHESYRLILGLYSFLKKNEPHQIHHDFIKMTSFKTISP